tara:strand:- start:4776 stop:5132 length:357 start_codon:yes stop_codon:yes gene_type:complete
MRTVYYLIALALVVIVSKLVFVNKAEAGGPWHDQYCDIETTQIKIVDTQGNVIDERIEEKVTCQDGVKDFLHGYGIADSCEMFTWGMPIGEELIQQRSVACHKMNGEYEIVKGYHSIF